MFPKLDKLDGVVAKIEALLARAETLLPATAAPAWDQFIAFRWRTTATPFGRKGALVGVARPHRIRFSDLKDVDHQKARLETNTRQFVLGKTANNILLTGARGTGKSSLVKAALDAFQAKGLRLIEVDRADLVDLPDIADLVAARPEKFIVYCDDLSFESGDAGYKALKSVLDGGISAASQNMLVYATSNRQHLMPQRMAENLEAKHSDDGEIHPGETTEEKISLSERFGLWLSFYPFDQNEYLDIVDHWVSVLGTTPASKTAQETLHKAALLWALERGSRSGRIAYQFARDWCGRGSGGSLKRSAKNRSVQKSSASKRRT